MMNLLPSLVLAFILGTASAQELGVIHMRLEGMREKCLVEDLPANTVCLGTPPNPYTLTLLILV
jgi:hypothetical protein